MTTPGDPEFRTFDLSHVVLVTGAPSEAWLRKHLNAGDFRGRLAGRTWRMTESDMAGLVAWMARGPEIAPVSVTPEAPATPPASLAGGLTTTSRRRLRRAS